MSRSAGFIVSIPDENTFYQIKNYLESLENSRLIYCTRSEKKLYITFEEGVND